MTENNIQRRDVLKAVGTVSAFGAVGTVRGAQAGESNVRLVEMGVEYNLPSGYNYQRVHTEGLPSYRIDGAALILNPLADADVRNTFVNNDVVINGVGQITGPSQTGEIETAEAIPTALAAREDPIELTHLTESHQLPNVRVEDTGSGLTVVAEDVRQTLAVNDEQEIQLSARPVTAETARVTDEIAEIEGVPEHRWGPKTEYGSVDIEATPTVMVRDRGEFNLQTRW